VKGNRQEIFDQRPKRSQSPRAEKSVPPMVQGGPLFGGVYGTGIKQATRASGGFEVVAAGRGEDGGNRQMEVMRESGGGGKSSVLSFAATSLRRLGDDAGAGGEGPELGALGGRGALEGDVLVRAVQVRHLRGA